MKVIVSLCTYFLEPKSRKYSWISQGTGSKDLPSLPLWLCSIDFILSVIFILFSLQTSFSCFSATGPLLHHRKLTCSSKSQSRIPGRGNLIGPMWVTCLCPEVCAVHGDFLLKRTAWKRMGRVEQLNKCYLHQVLKVNINNGKSCWWYVSFIRRDENGTSPLFLPPQNP